MRCLVVTWVGITGLALFVLTVLVLDSRSDKFHVNAVPPEGLEDTYFSGTVKFACPHIDYKFHYSLVSPLTSVQMVVEGRATPIDLCRPSSSSPGSAPLCPQNAEGILRSKKVQVPVCDRVRDSTHQIRIIPGGLSGPLAVGSLIRHLDK